MNAKKGSKSVFFLLGVLLLAGLSVVFSKAGPVAPPPPTGWYVQSSPTTDHHYNEIEAINQNTVWIVGNNGTADAIAVKTLDGGQNWTTTYISGLYGGDLFSVSVIDANHVWAAGYYGYSVYTIDGGSNWVKEGNGSVHGYATKAFSITDVYVGGFCWGVTGMIVHYLDSPNPWKMVYANSPTILDMSGPDTNHVFAVGLQGRIAYGGATNGFPVQTSGVGNELRGVSAVNASVAWAVGSGPIVLHTTDAGAHWRIQKVPVTESLNDVAAISDQVAWACGSNGTIIKTTNGGLSWIVQNSGTTEELRSITAADANTAWAVSPDGLILHTTDGGGAPVGLSPMDFVGTWNGVGVYYKNMTTGNWTKMAPPAQKIGVGWLYFSDTINDLIGSWPGLPGIWERNSSDGIWQYIVGTPHDWTLTSENTGDDFIGTWDGVGVYRYINYGWEFLGPPADKIVGGDLNGDGYGDIAGYWIGSGLWWRPLAWSGPGAWNYLTSASPREMVVADINNDGRSELIGTWDGLGVFYKDWVTGDWVMMAPAAEQIGCGDLDGDGTADLICVYSSLGGVWVKYSLTQSWGYLVGTPVDLAVGNVHGAAAWGVKPAGQPPFSLPSAPAVERAASGKAPGGKNFDLPGKFAGFPIEQISDPNRIPGPGEPGFHYIKEKNIEPRADTGPTRKEK